MLIFHDPDHKYIYIKFQFQLKVWETDEYSKEVLENIKKGKFESEENEKETIQADSKPISVIFCKLILNYKYLRGKIVFWFANLLFLRSGQ